MVCHGRRGSLSIAQIDIHVPHCWCRFITVFGGYNFLSNDMVA